MDHNQANAILYSEKPLFSEELVFKLEERGELIEKHKDELKYVCIHLEIYQTDVAHVINNALPISMISHLTYNMLINLVSCFVGMTIYEYLSISYLLSDNYDDNYELWKRFTDAAKKINNLIDNLEEENLFHIDESLAALNNLIPPKSIYKKPVRSHIYLQHHLAKINGEGLFGALRHYMKAIEDRLDKLKNGNLYLKEEYFDIIFDANFKLYKDSYWPTEGKNFRQHIEMHYFRRHKNPVDVLEDLLKDEQSDFEKTKSGQVWRDYYDDKKMLYFELKRLDLNEEQWKYFFKCLTRFDEYERWIDELEHPGFVEHVYPISDWDKIFNGAIDVTKVKIIIPNLLDKKITKPKLFVLHKVLEEIDWLQDCVDTHFFSWIDQVYGWSSSANNFKSIDSRLRNSHSLDWDIRTMTSASISEDYIKLANKIRNEFVYELDGKVVKRDNKKYFLKLDLYIEHKKKL